MNTARASFSVVCFAMVTISIASCTFGARTKGERNDIDAAAKTVLALDRKWGQAYITGDVDFVDSLLATDWQGQFDGKINTRANELAELRAGRSQSAENTIDDARVRVYGDTAIVVAHEQVKYRDEGGEHTLNWRITDVFVREHSRWLVVVSHGSTMSN